VRAVGKTKKQQTKRLGSSHAHAPGAATPGAPRKKPGQGKKRKMGRR
jgi:hypothetical protein